MRIKNKKVWLFIFVLIAIEQFIKIVINNNFLHNNLPIFPPFLYFSPIFNRRYSWFNSMLQLGYGKWLHIVIVSIMIVLIYLFYRYINEKYNTKKLIDVMFIFIFSGALCSLIDKIFWNGSLDYIEVSGFFTFDLKDVYIDIFIGLLILSLLIDSKAMKQFDDKNLLKDFGKYIIKK